MPVQIFLPLLLPYTGQLVDDNVLALQAHLCLTGIRQCVASSTAALYYACFCVCQQQLCAQVDHSVFAVSDSSSTVQVYKGRLHSGEQVAVKVQRPFVLETVTVDLFLVRSALLILVLPMRELLEFTELDRL